MLLIRSYREVDLVLGDLVVDGPVEWKSKVGDQSRIFQMR